MPPGRDQRTRIGRPSQTGPPAIGVTDSSSRSRALGQHDRAYEALARRDRVLAKVIAEYGHPAPFEWHDGGRTGSSQFAAMLLHIVSQQISAAAAFTIFDRIAVAAGGEVPAAERILSLGGVGLRACGLSNARVAYAMDLADAQVSGRVDLENLAYLDDVTVITVLTSIRGVGLWSAQMFLIHNLARPDVLPAGDPGVRRAIRNCWRLDRLPSAREVRARGEGWTPWRSYAAALLWRSLRPADELSDPKARALAVLARRQADSRPAAEPSDHRLRRYEPTTTHPKSGAATCPCE
jgi:DNA-3-methyladenine glycosylase II